jgi:hypothetical protein
MARNITKEEEEVIINCGAFNYLPEKIANVLNWPQKEVLELYRNKDSNFFKLLQKGLDTADYVLDLKLFELAQTGDLKALEEFENRRDERK